MPRKHLLVLVLVIVVMLSLSGNAAAPEIPIRIEEVLLEDEYQAVIIDEEFFIPAEALVEALNMLIRVTPSKYSRLPSLFTTLSTEERRPP